MKYSHWFLTGVNYLYVAVNIAMLVLLAVMAFVIFGDLKTFFESLYWMIEYSLDGLL
jgi:hypothetical protein